jgi:preprotein translocase subunit SecG
MIGQGGLIDRFYSPVVEVALNQTQEKALNQTWKVIATVTNYGSQPATNLYLSFRAPTTNNFTGITNEFSTTDITVRNFRNGTQQVPLQVDETINMSELTTRPSYVEVHAPKLSHGTGSKIVLAIKVQEFPNLNGSDSFDASAIYDQGSARWVYAGDWSYKGFVDNITKPKVLLTILWIALIIIFESVLWWGKKNKWFMKPKEYTTENVPVWSDWKGIIIRGLLYFLIAFGIISTVGYLPTFLFTLVIAILIVEILLGLAQKNKWFKKAKGHKKKERDFPTSMWRRIIFGIFYVLVALIIWTLPIKS